ncbi:MAG TPA: hypothetical protein VHH73_16250, partial [Verrucomicrobiae bacterium]|nr:hypothetical protein [Verrucomicrobiae bacterium]
MMTLLRLLLGATFIYLLATGRHNALANPMKGDLQAAFDLAVAAIVALLNAAVWAPVLGDWVSRPVTGAITDSTYYKAKNRVMLLARGCEARKWRRLTLFFCFIEGIRRPWMPEAFAVGFRNAKPGSWLEKVFAREVYRFDNAKTAVAAYQALQRHGMDPGPHRRPEVTLMLRAMERVAKAEAAPLPIPVAAPAPKPKRNPRIKLFDGAPAPAEPAAPETSQEDSALPAPEPPARSPEPPHDSGPTTLLPCFIPS